MNYALIYLKDKMFWTIFKALMSLIAIGAVIRLAIYEAKTWQNITDIAYYILAGVVFWINSDQAIKILDFFKK